MFQRREFYKEEEGFLSGPRTRWKELKYVMGVLFQYIKGFRALHFIGPCITVFGSARFDENHTYYKTAREISSQISKFGLTIMTGGGPGIMEAANRGAKDAGGLSIGCNIVLPHEQNSNPYLDKYVTIEYFFVRKELLRKYSLGFIVMPGGFGTLDEFFETITLIQTKKTEPFPVVIFGLDFHKNLIQHIKNMAAAKTINEEDLKLILFTDSIVEAVMHVEKYAVTKIGSVNYRKRVPNWLLGEKKINK